MFLLTADSGCMGDLIAVFVIFIGLPVVAIGVVARVRRKIPDRGSRRIADRGQPIAG